MDVLHPFPCSPFFSLPYLSHLVVITGTQYGWDGESKVLNTKNAPN